MMRVRVPTPPTYCSACDASAPLGILRLSAASRVALQSVLEKRCAILAPTRLLHNHQWWLCSAEDGGCQRAPSGS